MGVASSFLRRQPFETTNNFILQKSLPNAVSVARSLIAGKPCSLSDNSYWRKTLQMYWVMQNLSWVGSPCKASTEFILERNLVSECGNVFSQSSTLLSLWISHNVEFVRRRQSPLPNAWKPFCHFPVMYWHTKAEHVTEKRRLVFLWI